MSVTRIRLHTGPFKFLFLCSCKDPGARSRYSDWLRAGRSMGRNSSPAGGKNFHFSTSSRLALRSNQPPIEKVPGALTPGEKRRGRETDHSLPSSAEVKKIWIYTSTPPYASWRSAFRSWASFFTRIPT
jgi:hypothetical protein